MHCFPSVLRSMIQPQLGTPGRRSNTCIFQWTVVCHGFQVGSSWLQRWNFVVLRPKNTETRRAKLSFRLKHFFASRHRFEIGSTGRGLNCEQFLNIIHEAIHALAQSQFAFGKIGHHEPEDESVGEPQIETKVERKTFWLTFFLGNDEVHGITMYNHMPLIDRAKFQSHI